MKETWKTIKGYKNKYLISNLGNIKSVKRNIILNPPTHKGYFHVTLFNKNIRKWYYVHRLVALAFISNPKNKPYINHIDGNKQNNHVDNLKWCTQSENEKHANKLGLKNFKGENNGKSKLSNNDIFSIKRLFKQGLKQTTIAKLYDTTQSNISLIVTRKNWKHLL